MSGPPPADLIVPPPAARGRRWIAAFAALYLAWQGALPLRYYLGDDPWDERFSWRMFSAVRVARCRVRVQERRAGAWSDLDLERAIHAAWRTNLERNRAAVVEKLLGRRCREPGVEAVRLSRACADAAGRTLAPEARALDCATAAMKRAP